MRLCSGCLLGVMPAYTGRIKKNKKVLALSRKEILIPVCPELFGGLSVPRIPCERKGEYVFTKNGCDVTKQFKKGAYITLKMAKMLGIKEAIFKQKSPSCGCGKIYDGNFSGELIRGDGVTTALLKRHGIRVITEEDI